MRSILVLALVPLAALAACYMVHQDSGAATGDSTSDHPRPEQPAESTLKLPLDRPRILVEKSKRRLTLFDGDKPVRTYRIGLGFSPEGDKVSQGDGRTPEGSFYVCVKNTASKFYLSLGLSYPDKEHAERGMTNGLISRSQYNEIVAAQERKQRPPWDTRLGGEIFIHGNGASSDWTWGCVALDNTDIKELFDAVSKGTPVTIQP